MHRDVTLLDVVNNFEDDTQVHITAYNIPLFTGRLKDIPAMYCVYPLTERLKIQCGVLRIVLDC